MFLGTPSSGSWAVSYWFFSCNAIKGHSTGVLVDSLGGPEQSPLQWMQCLRLESGVST